MMQKTARAEAARQPGSRCDFGRMAETYDRWYETRIGKLYDTLEKRAVEKMLPPPAPGARLLDVGCGTGHWSAFFSARGFEVTGVDIAPEMIAVAKKKRIANAVFQVADAHSLPFTDKEFDVSAAITTLEFVRDADAVLRQMARCTRRPGGVILAGILNSLAQINVRRKAAGKPPYANARFFSPTEVKSMLAVYGEPRITVAAFGPRVASALPLAPLTELVGRLLGCRGGAFIVGRVML